MGLSERELVPYEASTFRASTVLVLAPHPDDEVFGCGAALADLAERGARVHVLVLTDGASDEPDADARRRIAESRIAESREALRILGGGELTNAAFRDRELIERLPELQAELERSLRSCLPDLVFAPSPAEVHPDHRAVAEAFLRAAEAGGREPLAGATVAFYELSQPIRPNFLFDATRRAAIKARAMAAFASQNAQRDYPRFITGLNAYRGLTLDVESAEAYYVVAGVSLANGARSFVHALGPSTNGASPRPLTFWERLRVLLTGERP